MALDLIIYESADHPKMRIGHRYLTKLFRGVPDPFGKLIAVDIRDVHVKTDISV